MFYLRSESSECLVERKKMKVGEERRGKEKGMKRRKGEEEKKERKKDIRKEVVR